MDQSPATRSPRRAFLKSPHHAVLALATLGAGFVAAEPRYLLIGAVAYLLGWLYLPDMNFFRSWMQKVGEHFVDDEARHDDEVAAFTQRRDTMVAKLRPEMREWYDGMVYVCRDIEEASSPDDLAAEARLRNVDELMWMFLRLLAMQESLDRFLEVERSEQPVQEMIAEAEQELTKIQGDLEQLKAKGTDTESKERLLKSKQERLDVLRKRAQRVDEAESNLQVVMAEQDRLAEQIKLIRADAVAMKNSDALSARITASVAQLNETSRWLEQMDQFKDLAAEPALPEKRVGFASATPPPPPPPPLPGATPETHASSHRRPRISQ
jgi:hypothetical protein